MPLARKVVTLVVESLTEAIKRDWLRTHSDVRELDGGAFCNDWWRGFDVKLAVDDFIKIWADPPILCEVQGAALHLRIGMDVPVARPGNAEQPLPPPQLPPAPVVHEPVAPAAAVPPAPSPPAADRGQAAEEAGGSPNVDVCPICLNPLNIRLRIATICGHEFHLDCLNNWTSRRNTCPSCRRRLPREAQPVGIG